MTVLGLLLGAFGLVLLNFGNTPTTSTAAEETYSSTWKATQLYRLQHTDNINQVTSANAIGVAEWKVTGTVGETPFTETWKGPSADSVRIRNHPDTNGICKGDYDPSQWLVGCIDTSDNRYGRFMFRLTQVLPTDSSLLSEGDYTNSGARHNWSGRSVACKKASSGVGGFEGCLTALGSYGFSQFIPKENTADQQVIGMMMPLQWTVTGEIGEP